MNELYLEVCADSVESALIAQNAGAYRIELCDNLAEGGTTPSYGMIEQAQKYLTIESNLPLNSLKGTSEIAENQFSPLGVRGDSSQFRTPQGRMKTKLYVLIRPRGGDFLYNDIEFEIMKSDIAVCGKLGCDGVVIGMLLSDGSIDKTRCQELINVANQYNMGVTFHRAFDRCNNLFEAMETVIGLGCERILTSGGKDTALEGAEIIRQLIEKSSERISIMPGAGITPENIAELLQKTNATEFHGTFKGQYPSQMDYRNVSLGDFDEEYTQWKVDEEKIRKVQEIIHGR